MNGLTVYENLWLAAARIRSRNDINPALEEVAEELALTPILRRSVGELAHGQRQMVELGLVMIQKPWLVLLDEPAAGITGGESDRLVEGDSPDQSKGDGDRRRSRYAFCPHVGWSHYCTASGGNLDGRRG